MGTKIHNLKLCINEKDAEILGLKVVTVDRLKTENSKLRQQLGNYTKPCWPEIEKAKAIHQPLENKYHQLTFSINNLAALEKRWKTWKLKIEIWDCRVVRTWNGTERRKRSANGGQSMTVIDDEFESHELTEKFCEKAKEIRSLKENVSQFENKCLKHWGAGWKWFEVA